jgi:hypothetical protein
MVFKSITTEDAKQVAPGKFTKQKDEVIPRPEI